MAAAVAANPNCPPRLSRWMAWSSDWAVQAAVAASPVTTQEVLRILAGNEQARVRLHVAANPAAPGTIIGQLLADQSAYVRAVAAGHPAAPAAGLRSLAETMSEPAWVLRAIATNSACAADLSDQILTWLALGGPGSADPLFDPMACTGHPADTTMTAAAWYWQQARAPGAESHPLWRVRAAVIPARRRISMQARELTRDPRPDVRRAVASFTGLPFNRLRELGGDDDPRVARIAATALQGKRRAEKKRRRIRLLLRLVPVGPVIAIALMTLVNALVSAPGSSLNSAMPVITGSGGITSDPVHGLPGGGQIGCFWVSALHLSLVSVSTGTEALTLSIPGAVTSYPEGVPAPNPVRLPAGQYAEFVLPAGGSLVTMIVTRPGKDSPERLAFPRCGR